MKKEKGARNYITRYIWKNLSLVLVASPPPSQLYFPSCSAGAIYFDFAAGCNHVVVSIGWPVSSRICK
ncbi:hypothetical protein AQUCO_01700387v1 [Aquilegia coerulea]|uniref:Uncharacterized protein n=1 Tax=Aquilegia coerulea TaxID=218851 RepID=A0A2G5DML9_AQUCA|nr:hypothetical protein AQUCO_01700387v1 [Aquilegia coerulea]